MDTLTEGSSAANNQEYGDIANVTPDADGEGKEGDDVVGLFQLHDLNRDGVLDYSEFASLLKSVFNGSMSSSVPEGKVRDFMSHIDSNKDGFVDMGEFQHAWSHCFKKVLEPVTALVIVDVQYDFIDGSLALRNCPAKQDGASVVPVINKLLDEAKFDVVVYSLDWHPDSHISFVDNVHRYPVAKTTQGEHDIAYNIYDEVQFDLSPARSQVLWPPHCIQGSDGAKLDKNLKVIPNSVNIYKGTKVDIDSYSAFFDNMKLSHTALQEELQKRNVTDVYVCGLAYDICVGATSRDSVELGYRTVVVDDACRGVSEENIKRTKMELTSMGALILQSEDVIKLVNKESCSFDLGLFTAQTMPMCGSTTV